jgi:hypothetical protein
MNKIIKEYLIFKQDNKQNLYLSIFAKNYTRIHVCRDQYPSVIYKSNQKFNPGE